VKRFTAIGFLAIGIAGCSAATRTASSPSTRQAVLARPASPALQVLVRDIDAIMGDPALARGYWGVLVKSLKSDDTLYESNARKLLIPASNMKIVTLAAAAERLGWNYTYRTQLLAAGQVVSDRLVGDLLVVGNGDPSIGLADGMADALFAEWAAKLKVSGIQSISGRVVGDDNAFDDNSLGFGWSWDDLPDDYAAGVSALQFNENAIRLAVAPGKAVGDSAAISITPVESGLVVHSTLTTAAADATPGITAHRLPGSSTLELRGTIPLGSAPVTRVVSVDNPTIFFVSALRRALIAQGIDVRGPAVDIDAVTDPPSRTGAREVLSYASPPLSTLALRLMKASQKPS
jgi:D-alanyl-D-alanine carboxypeptidase/D-alanyl-D-alanine-endopeptidase (penicillin-binding protein 4)